MTSALTQLLEILQSHGLMERSDEQFVSAHDLTRLDCYLGSYDDSHMGPRRTEDELRERIHELEERIDNALSALDY